MFSAYTKGLFLRAPPSGQQKGRPVAGECSRTLIRAPPAPLPGFMLAPYKRFGGEHRALGIISTKGEVRNAMRV